MAERMGFGGWSGVIATWVSVAGALVGGYLALQTYSEDVAKQEDARVVQTFALYDMFNSSERITSRQHLFAHIHDNTEYTANDLYIFLDFYDAVQICVERNLCDPDLSVRLFQSYAVPVWDEMKGSIVASRTDSDPNFGAGLQWMAAQPVPRPFDAPETTSAPAAAETTAPATPTTTATTATTAP